MVSMLTRNSTDFVSVEFAIDLSFWNPNLHPRDSHGRFRDTWGLPPLAKKIIDRILKTFHPLTARDDEHFQEYADRQAAKVKKTPEEAASLEYMTTRAGWADIQSTLRAGKDDLPHVRNFDAIKKPLEDDLILTRVTGPDAFGLPPERIGEVEEWTGKLVSDKGYASTNMGTPLVDGKPHVTWSILVPRGTQAVIPGGSRQVIIDREQPMRIMKVEADGHGGVNIYAVVQPAQGGGVHHNLGKALPPREHARAVPATPGEMAKRGLGPDGNPLPPAGAPAPPTAAAPAAKEIPPAGPFLGQAPQTPPVAQGADAHAGKAQEARDRIAADEAAGRGPQKRDVQQAEHHARLAKVEEGKKADQAKKVEEKRAAEQKDFEDRMKRLGGVVDRLEKLDKERRAKPTKAATPAPAKATPERPHNPELDARAAVRAKARERHQEIAARVPIAGAGTELDDLIAKKATNKVLAEHVRAHAMGPGMDEIRDPVKRAQVSRALEEIAQDLEKGRRAQALRKFAELEAKYHINRHGAVGDVVPFDAKVHESVAGVDIPDGTLVRIARPGASVLHEDNSRTQLHKALVRPATEGAVAGEAPKPVKAVKKAAKKAAPAAKAPAGMVEEAHPDGRDKKLVKDLRQEALNKGIKIGGREKKADIIAKLRAHDNGEVVPEPAKAVRKVAKAAKAVPGTLPEGDRPRIPNDLGKTKVAELRPVAVAHGIKVRDENGKLRPVAEIRQELGDLRAKRELGVLARGGHRNDESMPNTAQERLAQLARDRGKGGTAPVKVAKKAAPKKPAAPKKLAAPKENDPFALVPLPKIRQLAKDNGVPTRDENNKLIPISRVKEALRAKGIHGVPVVKTPGADQIPDMAELRKLRPVELRKLAQDHKVDVRGENGKLLLKDELVWQLHQKRNAARLVAAPPPKNLPGKVRDLPNPIAVHPRDLVVGDHVVWHHRRGARVAGVVRRLGQNAVVLEGGDRIPYRDWGHVAVRARPAGVPNPPVLIPDNLRGVLIGQLRELADANGVDHRGVLKDNLVRALDAKRRAKDALGSFGRPVEHLRGADLAKLKLPELQQLAEDNGVPWHGLVEHELMGRLAGVPVLHPEDRGPVQAGFKMELGELRKLAAKHGIRLHQQDHRDDLIAKLRERGADDPTSAVEDWPVSQLRRAIQDMGHPQPPANFTREQLVEFVKNPPKQEFHHDPDAGVLDLEKMIARGIKRVNPINGGAMGETGKAELEGGGEAIRKAHQDMWGITAKQQADAEQLASVLARHGLGMKGAPPVWRQDLRTIFMGFVHGQIAHRVSKGDKDVAIASPEGAHMALLDAITGNSDRHEGNWFVRGGRPVPIDHGLTWSDISEGPRAVRRAPDGEVLPAQSGNISPFMSHWVAGDNWRDGWKDKIELSRSELQKTRARLEGLRPQFAMLGREAWLDVSLERLDAIMKRATLP